MYTATSGRKMSCPGSNAWEMKAVGRNQAPGKAPSGSSAPGLPLMQVPSVETAHAPPPTPPFYSTSTIKKTLLLHPPRHLDCASSFLVPPPPHHGEGTLGVLRGLRVHRDSCGAVPSTSSGELRRPHHSCRSSLYVSPAEEKVPMLTPASIHPSKTDLFPPTELAVTRSTTTSSSPC